MSRDPLQYRSPALVIAILGIIYDNPEPTPWFEIVDLCTSPRHPARTVENTLYDLVAYGAAHRVGQPGTSRKPDTRALKPTVLGRHWLDHTNPPPPPGEQTP